MEIPTIRNYMDYSSDNYGSSRQVDIEFIRLYYSYKTVVAFSTPDTGLVIRKNEWSTTTGKHLNAINSDHSIRISGLDFEKHLEAIMDRYKIVDTMPHLEK